MRLTAPWLLGLLLAACEVIPPVPPGTPSLGTESRSTPPGGGVAAGLRAANAEANPVVSPARPTFGPEILLPASDSLDEPVGEVDGLTIYKRHVFDRVAQGEPGGVRAMIQTMKLDVLVARVARGYGISVNEAVVAKMVAEKMRKLREQVAKDLGPRVSFAEFVQRRWNVTVEEHEQWLRSNQVLSFYREYVLRFVAMREDRVAVRYIVHSDRKVLEDVAARVRQGADFATLAMHHSEDPNRNQGGALPPFGRGYEHVAAEVAFDLEVGQLSEIFARESDGVKRFYLVYCRDKIPGRDVAFSDVQAELDRQIRAEPLPASEFDAAAKLLRARFEELKSRAPMR